MRSFALVIGLALGVLSACAHAQEEVSIARAVARVMVAALAEEEVAPSAYAWDALSARVSRHMHWHLPEPAAIDRPPDAITHRYGWIAAAGAQVGVSARGPDERVASLSFEARAFDALALIEALRAEGAEVSFAADWEESSDYVIRVPGRESADLTSTRLCTPPESRAGRHCHYEFTLAFELP